MHHRQVLSYLVDDRKCLKILLQISFGIEAVLTFAIVCSKELYQLSDNKLKKQKKVGSKARELMLEQQLNQSTSSVMDPMVEKEESKATKPSSGKNIRSHYAFNKPLIPPVCIDFKPVEIMAIILTDKQYKQNEYQVI